MDRTRRVLRGGSFLNSRELGRCVPHNFYGSSYYRSSFGGFRVVMNREKKTCWVVRSSSFGDGRVGMRSAYRLSSGPHYRSRGGFRVVVSEVERKVDKVCWVLWVDSLGYHRKSIRSAYRGLLTPHIRVVVNRVREK